MKHAGSSVPALHRIMASWPLNPPAAGQSGDPTAPAPSPEPGRHRPLYSGIARSSDKAQWAVTIRPFLQKNKTKQMTRNTRRLPQGRSQWVRDALGEAQADGAGPGAPAAAEGGRTDRTQGRRARDVLCWVQAARGPKPLPQGAP